MATVRRDDLDLLPHNPDAERAVLGACLLDPDAVMRCRETELEADDFLGEHHRHLYAAVMDLADRGRDADLLNVSDLLSNRRNGQDSQLEGLGGEAGLADLLSEAMGRGTVSTALRPASLV